MYLGCASEKGIHEHRPLPFAPWEMISNMPKDDRTKSSLAAVIRQQRLEHFQSHRAPLKLMDAILNDLGGACLGFSYSKMAVEKTLRGQESHLKAV